MLAAIVVCAAVTYSLRLFPVLLAHRFRDREDLREISALLPAGLMLILVAYTLLEADSGMQLSRLILAALISVVVNLASKNFLIAFIAGFAVYFLSGVFL
ncbi:AzlD domain-containing protein [Kocuria marina]|uniref:AzlD domain-containing protein n=1 Tax=Kocuria marina TaxID=223184 RepID=UPI0011A169DF|nr:MULTISPECIES: AzlD domain-containing protein [Kocuria]MCT2021810.1 AzlD domain-containing protein [Kocuria marina]